MNTPTLINLVVTLETLVLNADTPSDMRTDAQTSLTENIGELTRRAEQDDQARRFILTRSSSLIREGDTQ